MKQHTLKLTNGGKVLAYNIAIGMGNCNDINDLKIALALSDKLEIDVPDGRRKDESWYLDQCEEVSVTEQERDFIKRSVEKNVKSMPVNKNTKNLMSELGLL